VLALSGQWRKGE